MTVNRRLVGYVLGVLVLVLFAWRGETADRALAEYVQNACEMRQENTLRLNHQNATFRDIEDSNPYASVSPATVARRIAAYEAAILTVPDCSQPP